MEFSIRKPYSERFVNHGRFGVYGKSRVSLLQSTAPSGMFYADYRAGQKRIFQKLETCDLEEAKKRLDVLITELGHGKHPALRAHSKVEVFLYVIQQGESGPIKVGISRNVRARMSALQTSCAEPLKIIRTFKMRDVEGAFHAKLEEVSRLCGEWFPAELVKLIDGFFNTPTARYRIKVANDENTDGPLPGR